MNQFDVFNRHLADNDRMLSTITSYLQDLTLFDWWLEYASGEMLSSAALTTLAAWRGELSGVQSSNDKAILRRFLMRFVSKVELGYDLARISYSYPMADLLREQSDIPWGHLALTGKVVFVSWA